MQNFIASRRQDWHTLERLLARLGDEGPRHLSTADLDTLGRLYRRATSDLAIAQRDFPDEALTTYLNQLVARAHPQVYRSQPFELRAVLHFLVAGFPQVFRRTAAFTIAGAAIFLVSALVMGFAVSANPDSAQYFVSQDLIDTIQEGEMWTDIPRQERSIASSFIMSNNIRVAILAFGGGVLAGIPTLLVMSTNGLMLGAIAALCAQHGLSLPFWSFVLPHGVIELSVIFIVGGAGLQLAHSLLAPGRFSRRESLVRATGTAIQLVLGCLVLLVVAGIVEGFVSPSSLAPNVKLGLAAFLGTGLYAYLILGGRGHHASQ